MCNLKYFNINNLEKRKRKILCAKKTNAVCINKFEKYAKKGMETDATNNFFLYFLI